MRHRRDHKKLGRPSQPRKALLRGLVQSLFRHGKLVTTEPRAKEMRRLAEKLITRAKVDSLHNRRVVQAKLVDKKLTSKLFSEIAPKYRERPGGYTRIVKLTPRRGDSSSQVLIELVESEKKAG